MPEFLTTILESQIMETISGLLEGYINQGVAFFEGLDTVTQTGVVIGGAILLFLGAIDLIKRMSKLIIIAVVVFGLWFVYSNYVAV